MKEYIEIRTSGDIKHFLDESIVACAKCIPGPLPDDDIAMETCIFELPSDDPRWKKILETCEKLEQAERKIKKSIFYKLTRSWVQKSLDETTQLVREDAMKRGWEIRPHHGYWGITVKRFYTKEELRAAEILQVIPYHATQFDRKIEDTAQIYNLEKECPMCRIAVQKADLIFKSPKFPKKENIICLVGYNETLISEKLAGLFEENKVTGYTVRDIYQRKLSEITKIPGWKQLVFTSEVSVSEETVFGYDYFHPDKTGKWACKVCGLTKGQGIQSPLFIKRETWDGSDIATTKEYIGGGTTIGYPLQLTVISQRLYRLLIENKIKLSHVEVAHLV